MSAPRPTLADRVAYALTLAACFAVAAAGMGAVVLVTGLIGGMPL